MSTLELDKIFNPKSIAVIGASDEEGSVGYKLINNILAWKEGKVYPVNIRKKEILGQKAYQSISEISETVDLAVIATPAKTVPGVLEECGKAGVKGAIIISAGFKETGAEGLALEKRLIEIKNAYNMRIIGPNCLGIIRPGSGLNASFANKMPAAGNIAFISQSGALGSAILDWAAHENIGFSNFVSVGSMIDVAFSDLIDYFGTDTRTRSILMYIEGITSAKKFMSAARHFARTKPIIVIKAGRFSESAKAAASHTGALAGESAVYNAAFKRAGVLVVDEIEDLFNCTEVLSMQPNPKGPNLAIITNAGGPGVMSTDALIARNGKLAKLSQKTLDRLNEVLPPFWSKSNPIDILGDANVDRYKAVVEACLSDEGVDGLLVIYTPQGGANPNDIAIGVAELWRNSSRDKTLLTSFMGYSEVEEANQSFRKYSIPTYETPDRAVATYMYMYQYERNLELLYETPEELSVDNAPPKRPLTVLMQNAAREGRQILTEVEAKKILEYYGIPVVKTFVAKNADEAVTLASQVGYPIVLKILSPQIVHKTNAGGVLLDLETEPEVKQAFEDIVKRAKAYDEKAEIQGVTVEPMIKRGYEVILGAKTDPVFGPVIMFGSGGVTVELFRDVSLGLPPLNQTLARRMMEETKVYQLLRGFRNAPPANIKLLEETMVQFSQLLIDFPEIKEVDINPFFVGEKDAYALDARMVIDDKIVLARPEPHSHLVISPYPRKYETLWRMRDGRTVLLRPIRPEDEPMWLEMFQNFSERSIRYRFFQMVKDTPHEVRVRYCNIDYDREIGIVVELTEDGKKKIAGVVRLIIEPDNKTGEIAIVVADPWQNLGLGTKMMDHMIEICKDKKLEVVYGELLKENYRAIDLMKKMGFVVEKIDQDTVKATLNLRDEICS